MHFLFNFLLLVLVPRCDPDLELFYVHIETWPVREMVWPLPVPRGELERLQEGCGEDVHLGTAKYLTHTAPMNEFKCS